MRPLPFRAVLVEAVVSGLVFFVVGLSIRLWIDGRTLQEAFSIRAGWRHWFRDRLDWLSGSPSSHRPPAHTVRREPVGLLYGRPYKG
ncbi:hypothetical protein [Thermoflexus sp.]|uniref:hypothetical protein n=1 Tax=Thermoflexus sp. TaxID=1969742 RepID=UPI002ADD91A4|nr:hypothetical protein [Thermoflexus sp.]